MLHLIPLMLTEEEADLITKALYHAHTMLLSEKQHEIIDNLYYEFRNLVDEFVKK